MANRLHSHPVSAETPSEAELFSTPAASAARDEEAPNDSSDTGVEQPDLGDPAVQQRARKMPQDTAEGCRERAAADLAQAAMMDTSNGRKRFELSAATWVTRADLLQRLDISFEKRKALDLAEWQRADEIESQIPDWTLGPQTSSGDPI